MNEKENTLTAELVKMAYILIECAKNRSKITFKDLGQKVGVGKRQVGRKSGIISRLCDELDLPLLSVLVVYRSTGETGGGFVTEFFPAEAGKGRDAEIFEREMKRVYDQKDWSKLTKFLEKIKTNGVAEEYTPKMTSNIVEGDVDSSNQTHRTRNAKLKKILIKDRGAKCEICGFKAEDYYGNDFVNKIHIHHKKPISEGVRITDLKDVILVCPNCHMILHSAPGGGVYKPEDVGKFWEEAKKKREEQEKKS